MIFGESLDSTKSLITGESLKTIDLTYLAIFLLDNYNYRIHRRNMLGAKLSVLYLGEIIPNS